MAISRIAPDRPRANLPFVDPKTGLLTNVGLHNLDQIWQQVAAGFVIVPCVISGTNILTLTPTLATVGGTTLANYMTFAGVIANTSTGAVTAILGTLPAIKVFKSNGAAQAGAGDLVATSLYLFTYNSALDAAAGGFVAK